MPHPFIILLIAWITGGSMASGADVIELDDRRVTESSGLAFSHRSAERFWTHNDSGDRARLYAFDRRGNPSGHCHLQDARASDWEDMASFVDRVPRLLVADCGDNDRNRKRIELFVFDEPDPDRESDVENYQTIRVQYPDGPRDCESVAVDATRRLIILASKSPFAAEFYVVPLPERRPGRETISAKARLVKQITLPMATGMDVNARTGDLWIISYFHAFHLPLRQRGGSLRDQLVDYPKPFDPPHLRQIEAIGLDSLGQVWVTSEGSPAKMSRVRKP